MTAWAALAIIGAGTGAGLINAVVGSGTLITFPVLLALGYPPVTANVSNNLGLVFGSMAGTVGYRQDLAGTRPLLTRLLPSSLIGGVLGAVLLLWLPARAFATVVPVLIALAVVLVVAQPRIAAATARRGSAGTGPAPGAGPAARVGVLGAAVYGGYFGAAQGVLLIGLLGALLTEPLRRIVGVKNALASVDNGMAALTFLLLAPQRIDWAVVALISAGSITGGLIGAIAGRRLPPAALRGVIVAVGLIAVVRLIPGLRHP